MPCYYDEHIYMYAPSNDFSCDLAIINVFFLFSHMSVVFGVYFTVFINRWICYTVKFHICTILFWQFFTKPSYYFANLIIPFHRFKHANKNMQNFEPENSEPKPTGKSVKRRGPDNSCITFLANLGVVVLTVLNILTLVRNL